MKSARSFVIVLVTAPDMPVARRLARSLLREKLAACVNLIPDLESHYWWQGRIESGSEVLLMIKTARTRLRALEKRVLALHPYETPECLVLGVDRGTQAYLAWLQASLRKAKEVSTRR